MKSIYLLVSLMLFWGCHTLSKTQSPESILDSGKTTNLNKMDEPKRLEYLTKLSKEMVLRFFPAYYRDVVPTVAKMTASFSDNEGRIYYLVSYPYDATKMSMGNAAKISIWGDTGEPFDMVTWDGTGINMRIWLEAQKAKKHERNEPYTR